MLKLLMIYGHGIQLWSPVDPLLSHLSNSVVISLVTLLFASTVELLLPHFIIHVNTCVYSSTLWINISPKYMHTHIYHTSSSRECMSQACSCTQFIKSCIFYKSRKNCISTISHARIRTTTISHARTVSGHMHTSEHAVKSKVHMVILMYTCITDLVIHRESDLWWSHPDRVTNGDLLHVYQT